MSAASPTQSIQFSNKNESDLFQVCYMFVHVHIEA